MDGIFQFDGNVDAGRAIIVVTPTAILPASRTNKSAWSPADIQSEPAKRKSSGRKAGSDGHDVFDTHIHDAIGEEPGRKAGESGQMGLDTQLISAALNSPARKGSWPRKAIVAVIPNQCMPSAANPIDGNVDAGGHCANDTHANIAPGDFTNAQRSKLLELHAERKTLMAMRIGLTNRAAARVRSLCGFQTMDDTVEYVEGSPEAKAFKAIMDKVAARARGIVSAITDGKVLDDPAYQPSINVVRMANLTAHKLQFGDVDAKTGLIINGEKAFEAEMVRLVKTHPLHLFQKSIAGFGDASLAIILAEAKWPLINYATPSRLWKRLGLGLVQCGDGPWKTQGRPGKSASKEEWIAHGYSPSRRAAVFVMAESMLKHQHRPGGLNSKKTITLRSYIGPYGAVYRHEKAKKLWLVRDCNKRIKAKEPGYDIKSPEHWSRKRAHNHAMRLMSKALILDLWRISHGQEPRHASTAE